MLAVCEHLGARTPELSQALGDSAQAWPWDQKSQRFVFLHLPVIKGRKTLGVRPPGALESNFNWNLPVTVWSITVGLSLLGKRSATKLHPNLSVYISEPDFGSCCDLQELFPRTLSWNFSFCVCRRAFSLSLSFPKVQ